MAAHRFVHRHGTLERAVELAREDDVDDVLRPRGSLGEIDSTIAIGPSTGLVVQADEARLLGELPLQRLDERLAAPHPSAGKQPVLAPALLVADEEDRPVPAQQGGSRMRGSGRTRRQLPDEPSPPSPRSLGGLVHLDELDRRQLDDDELRDAHAGLDDERLVPVGVVEDHLHLAAVALVDQAGAFTLPSPCRAARPERGITKPAWPGGIATAIPVPTTRAPAQLDALAGREIDPVAAYAWARPRRAAAASRRPPLPSRRPRSRLVALRLGARVEVAREPAHVAVREPRARRPLVRVRALLDRRAERVEVPTPGRPRTARAGARRRTGRRTARRRASSAPRAPRLSRPRCGRPGGTGSPDVAARRDPAGRSC